jgi:aminopeptidase N
MIRNRTTSYILFFIATMITFTTISGCSESPETAVELDSTATDQVFLSTSPTIPQTQAIAPTKTPEPTITPTQLPPPESGSPSIGDNYAPELGNTGYDVQSYAVHLRLNPANPELSGSVQITARIDAPALNRFSLDFAGFTITSLTISGLDAKYWREGAKLWIDLPESAYQDELITLDIQYEGAPLVEPSPYVPFIGHVGLYYPGNTIFSLSEPNGAHYWFPSNDHPRDKATLEITLTVPDNYIGVSNGTLVATQPSDAGWTSFFWQHPYPTAPYLALAAVGDYERIDSQTPGGVPIRHYVYPDLMDEFLAATSTADEALDWMADLYGPYPFESFGFVTTRLVSFASETQTMVILPETSLNEETVIHEIAHMWFGNWVSLDSWADMWLKEGLAIYSYLLWQTRNQPADLDYFMEERTNRMLSEASGYDLSNLPKSQLLGTDTYWKGAVVIHALRKEIGDEYFFTGLRTVLTEYGGKNVSLTEFQHVMEIVSGKSLSPFFEFWVYGS